MLGKSPSSILQDTHTPEIQRMIQECTIDSSRGWKNALQFPGEENMNELVSAFRNIGGSSDLQIENPEKFLQPPTGPQEGLSLSDQELKFFVCFPWVCMANTILTCRSTVRQEGHPTVR